MADPLRRTLLAKLRGKKSKKGTTAGGCGVAANGGREGKDKVLQKPDEQSQQAIIVAELNIVSDTLKGNDNYFTERFTNGNTGLVRETTVVESKLPQCEASVHINTRRGDIPCTEDLRLRGRVNEELLGVSVQRETQERGSDSDEMSSFNNQELSFTRQVRPGSFGRSQGQKKHPVPIPRQHSGGDSIGFGMCENLVLKSRMVCTDMGARKLADGQYPVSKNNGTNVGCEKDQKIRCDRADFFLQSEPNIGFMETLRDIKDANVRTDRSQVLGANSVTNGTHTYQFGAPYVCHKIATDNVEENILIRNIESYGSSSEHPGEYKVSNLQSPTFFPTELEICDVNMASRCVGVREGTQRHNSLDSEDDDYYDNEILPFYETEYQNLEINEGKVPDQVDITNSEFSDSQDNFKKDANDSALETDRLRTQLKEAYYLLINAMHDISFDSQVSVNGFVDKASTSSHSQDSVCSQSSAKVIDSDAWSSGENSPQQVSDTDAVPLNPAETHEQCAMNFVIGKSLENLSTAKVRPILQRSVSDGAIKYPIAHSSCLKNGGSGTCVVSSNRDNLSGPDCKDKQLADDGVSSDDLLQDNGDDGPLNESSGSVNSLTGSSDNAETQGNKQDICGAQGGSSRPHGVTVNKMQEWMHKGRMLSSEMKQRITGSSLRAHGQSSLRSGHGVSNRTKAATQMTRVEESKSVAPCGGALQSALIENVHSSITASREVRVSAVGEHRPPLNTITVSKKRNWLQQSSGKDGLPTAGVLEDQGQVATPPSPPPESQRPAPSTPHAGHCKPPRLHPSHVIVTHARAVDPAEENDADDEGEIWYNPIPEDEEPDSEPGPGLGAALRLQVPQGPELGPAPQRKASGGDCGRGLGTSSPGPEGAGECQGGPGGEASHANTAHSTEPAQLHRQMFACKPADENPAPRATTADGVELANPGFSPPSSPNPLKKGSTINWSFPDKIKSPRTVRKLSIKMKKLPDLSRKLSVKGTPSISQPEPRPSSPKNHSGAEPGPTPARLSPGGGQTAASRNVISRYHLDSSVSTQQSYSKKSNSGGSKSASKGGYLSDGDSPELVAKSGKHGSDSKGAGKARTARELQPQTARH
ncbi:hypothetical protein AGOR_G00149420 [Albula goreensis]|uniref:Uncharacterized protein n=1 Tax=Albula goreensis TaxID=1534307 RepID=A0A8T3D301_9TELE|nr:hypothetical protein AGOR_G00149420 [Albula goreensis]